MLKNIIVIVSVYYFFMMFATSVYADPRDRRPDRVIYGFLTNTTKSSLLGSGIRILTAQNRSQFASLFVSEKTRITKDGKTCSLVDLHIGDPARVTYVPEQMIATEIRALSRIGIVSGIINSLVWESKLKPALKVGIIQTTGKSKTFYLHEGASIEINNRAGGIKDLKIGDLLDVASTANNTRVSVLRFGEPIYFRCVLKEIRFIDFGYVFFVQSTSRPTERYALTVTPQSKLYRNGKPATPSEFRFRDYGLARFYLDDLQIIYFKASSVR